MTWQFFVTNDIIAFKSIIFILTKTHESTFFSLFHWITKPQTFDTYTNNNLIQYALDSCICRYYKAMLPILVITFIDRITKSANQIWNRFIQEEDAALDQWISVLVLAILAIIIFVALRGPITVMLNGAVGKVGQETNELFNNATTNPT